MASNLKGIILAGGSGTRLHPLTHIACPEEISWSQRWIDAGQLERLALRLNKSAYGEYLLRLLHMGRLA